MIFDWQYAWEILPTLAGAAVTTLKATVAGFAVAATLGLALAILRRSTRRWIALPVGGFVEFVRSTPVLIQIYFLFFVLPETGVSLPAFTTGVIALGLHYAAYCSEVYRAGLDAIPKGQWEAATALNLSPYRVYRDIIIPQAIPPVVPALGNYLVAMFKETPLLSAIAVLEMMQVAKIVGSRSFQYVEPITIAGAFFLVMSLVAAALIRRLEAFLKRKA